MTDFQGTKAFTNKTVPATPGTQPLASLPQELRSIADATAKNALDSIVAAPLNPPDFVNLTPVNPNISFRYVMHTLYKQDGTQNAIRFEESKQQGFQVARKEDIKNPPMAYLKEDGTFVNGDLILMKMERKRYEGALLYKDQQAAKQMLAAGGQSAAKKVQGEVGYAVGNQTKIKSFVPTDSELAQFAGQEGAEGL